MRILLLALRNLGRNIRRTLITLAAIAFGLALMVVGVNLQAGQHADLENTAIATLAGHVVVQDPHYRDEREATLVVPRAAELGAGLVSAHPGSQVTQRIWLDGLLSSSAGSVGAAVTAVDPVAEAAITDVELKVVDGAWLEAGDDRGIVLGQGMAERLGVDVGDKVVFMGQFGQEEVQSKLFRVRGIFRTGAVEVDGFTAWATLGAGQELLGRPDVAHQIALHLPDGGDAHAAVETSKAVIAGVDAPGVEVLHYQGALPELWALLELDRTSNDVMMGIFGVIVAMGVLNTVLMSVMERSREFGVLMAIGMRPGRLAGLVLLEALLLGLLGAGLGLALGCALSWPLVQHGLDYSEMLGESFDTGGVVVSAVIKARYDVERLTDYFLASVAFTVLAAAYPAFQVARLTPLQAMHKV